jgi:hypothetical protein
MGALSTEALGRNESVLPSRAEGRLDRAAAATEAILHGPRCSPEQFLYF